MNLLEHPDPQMHQHVITNVSYWLKASFCLRFLWLISGGFLLTLTQPSDQCLLMSALMSCSLSVSCSKSTMTGRDRKQVGCSSVVRACRGPEKPSSGWLFTTNRRKPWNFSPGRSLLQERAWVRAPCRPGYCTESWDVLSHRCEVFLRP